MNEKSSHIDIPKRAEKYSPKGSLRYIAMNFKCSQSRRSLSFLSSVSFYLFFSSFFLIPFYEITGLIRDGFLLALFARNFGVWSFARYMRVTQLRRMPTEIRRVCNCIQIHLSVWIWVFETQQRIHRVFARARSQNSLRKNTVLNLNI